MFRQSPRKNQRSGGMKTKRVLQIGLLLGVFIWLFVHGSDKKESSQQDPKFSEMSQQYGNDNVIKFGRKDLKLKREAYSEDEKPMDVLPLERSHFEDETKPEEQDNNMGMVKHIENYANNLKETETEEGGVAKVGTLGKMEDQVNNMGTVEHIENFADNLKETETEEGGVAKEGKDEDMIEDGRGNGNGNQLSDDQKMDGVEKDIIDVDRIDNFNKIDDKMFEDENNEPDAGKDDGEHTESEGASIRMKKNMKKHGKSKTGADISDGERGERTTGAVNMSKGDTDGETTVDNNGKGNEYGETIDGNARKEHKSAGTLEANENGDRKIADIVESEMKLENEFGEPMEENQSKESTNNVMKEENEGKGKVSENSQKSLGDEVSMEQKLAGKVSENSQKSAGDEVSLDQKLVQESDGIKGKGNEKRIGKDKKGGKELVKNDKVGNLEDVLNETISLPEGKIIGTSNKSSKNIQENNPGAKVASGVTFMTSKNGTETEKGSFSQPEKTRSNKKSAEKENSNDMKTLTAGNQNKVTDYEQQLLGSTEKHNTNDEKSNLPSTKVNVKVANSDPNGSNDVESVAAEVQNAKPKTSQIMTDISGVEAGQNAEPKTYQGSADKSGVKMGQNAEPKTYQDTADGSGVIQGQKKSSMNEINGSDEHLKLGTDPKGDGKTASFNDDIGTNAGQRRREKPSDFSSSSVNDINKSDVPHTSTDAKPGENLASVSDNNGASTQNKIKNLSHVTSSSNEDEIPMSHAEGTENLSHDTSSSNGDETQTSNEEETAVDSSEKTAEEMPDINEDESSSGSLSQEEKEARTDLDTLPELGTSNNDASE